MPGSNTELYHSYNRLLIDRVGLDWFNVVRKHYLPNGYWPGIYPDVALLLEMLATREDVSSLTEFGAGMSTLFLAASARRHGKTFVSYETDPAWADFASRMCLDFGIAADIRPHTANEKGQPICDWTGGSFEVGDTVFLDCDGGLRGNLLGRRPDLFGPCQFVLVDDSEGLGAQAFIRALGGMGRYNLFMYNPTGRKDRTALIAPRDQGFPVNEWIWEWLPDQPRGWNDFG